MSRSHVTTTGSLDSTHGPEDTVPGQLNPRMSRKCGLALALPPPAARPLTGARRLGPVVLQRLPAAWAVTASPAGVTDSRTHYSAADRVRPATRDCAGHDPAGRPGPGILAEPIGVGSSPEPGGQVGHRGYRAQYLSLSPCPWHRRPAIPAHRARLPSRHRNARAVENEDHALAREMVAGRGDRRRVGSWSHSYGYRPAARR
jgi:hypothetical protein